jgi:glycosyltransferase involved in cell wall biosynthesis
MKKVLIISYSFPPRMSVGGLRIQGLAKYLLELDWDPIILTPKLPGSPNTKFRIIQTPYRDVIGSLTKAIGFKTEEGVKSQIKKKLGVSTHKNKRTFADSILLFIQENIAYPDLEKGWYQYAIKAGSELLQQENIDAIISSSSPVTCHLIAKELKMKYRIPWIADLRDLWTQNHYYQYTRIRKFWERRLELKTLREADALVTVSWPLAEKLRKLHKGKTVYPIPNGFDPEEVNSTPNANLTKEFTITYTGQIYQGKQDPSKLFKNLHDLFSERKINPNDIGIKFYGSQKDWLDEDITYYKLQDIVKCYGEIPREGALKKQRESQLLLLLLWENPNEKGIYTSKVFEYLAAQRPILATSGTEGVVKELLDDTNAGICVVSIEEIKKAIEKFYNEYKEKGYVSYKGERAKIDKYSHKEMARKFSEVLNNITTGK